MLNQFASTVQQNEFGFYLLILFCSLCFFYLWEQISPERTFTQSKKKRWLSNTGLLCSNILLLLMPVTIIAASYFTTQQQVGLLYHLQLPFYLLLIIGFLLLDFSSYLQHTLLHALPLLWRAHRVHHTDMDLDISTGLRFHPFEALLSSLLTLAIVILFGLPLLSVILYEVVRYIMLLFTHSNIHINHTTEKILRFFIVTPSMHRLHHSNFDDETNSNFSLNLSLWDRLFNTYKAASTNGSPNIVFGLKLYNEDKCQRFFSLLKLPFMPSTRHHIKNLSEPDSAGEITYLKAIINKQSEVFRETYKNVNQINHELDSAALHLSDSENFQNTLITTMIDSVITSNSNGIILSFNPAAEKIFGYQATEVIGTSINMLMPAEAASKHDQHFNEHDTADNKVIGISREIHGRHKDGSIFPIDISISSTNKNEQQVFTAVLRDISARIKARAQLKAQKEQLENILGNTADVYITINQQWIITYANPACIEVLDINPATVVGLDLHESLPDIISMFYKILRATLNSRKAHHNSVLYGPTMKYLDAHAYPSTEGIILQLRDITETKQAAEYLRLAYEKEIIQNEKLKHVAQLTSYKQAIDEHAIVSVTDARGIIIDVNRKFCEVSGYTAEELLGKDHRIVNSGMHTKVFFADLWQTISSGKKWHQEVCNKAKDGTLYWVDSAIVPLKDQQGNIERYISVRIDITERKHQEAEINKALSDLSVANKILEKISLIDGLTQIANRRCFDETLNSEISRINRVKAPLSLLICDIDYFKTYNDSYGHQAGDHCLQQVAQSIQSSFLRAGDLVARYGGEEFAVILPNTDQITALKLAENMHSKLLSLELEHKASAAKIVTLSTGVTTTTADKECSASALISKADQALYQAKENGRNNVQYLE